MANLPARPRLRASAVLAALLAAALLVALAASGGAGAAKVKSFSFSAPSLYPSFDAGRRFYVARCERGRLRVSIRARRGVASRVGGERARMGSYRIRRTVTPGHDFKIRVGGGGRGPTYQVRCLPEGFPPWRFEKLRRIPDGLFVLGSRAGPGRPPFVAIFDHAGVPRWWYRSNTRAINAQVLKAGTVAWSRAYGDGYGRDPRQAQEVRSLSGRLLRLISTKGAINDPHELFQEPNGNVLLESYVPRVPVDLRPYGGPRRGGIVYPRIQEQTSRGRVIRTVSLLNSLTPAETNDRWWDPILRNPRQGPRGIPVFDVIHVNSLEPWGKEKLVVSTRHTDAVYGIDRLSGEVLWKLGGKPHPRSLRFVGEPNPPGQLFGGQHDARIYGKGTLTLFDNSQDRPRPPRGVIYRLDLRARTATLVRQLIDPKAQQGNCCGSMRAIPGGWLVGFGDTPLVTGFTKSGKVAFRLTWGNSYRAMPVRRGHVSLEALDRGLERLERSLG